MHRRDGCRACESKNLEFVFSLRPSPIGDAYVTKEQLPVEQPSYPIELYQCQSCGLAQLLDVIDPEVLYGDYIYVTGNSPGLEEHFRNYATSVAGLLKKGDFVLDIGSNDGELLKHFKSSGMKVLGLEPASHIAKLANENGIETVTAFLNEKTANEIVKTRGKPKLITSNNVFANIDDLHSWIEAVKILLDVSGIYVFESFYLSDVIKNTVFDFIYHEHLSAFSVRPIKKLFESHGLELVSVEHVPTKGGSLRYFVQRPGGLLKDDGSVEKFLKTESFLYEPETYKNFTKKVEDLKSKTLIFLNDAKHRRKTFAGFGASITCTTLINHFELGDYVRYLVDDNPLKQGLYSPGLHIPVFPTSEIYKQNEKKPDYVITLAWRFAEPFISRNQAYIKNGGSFLIPVPEFRIFA